MGTESCTASPSSRFGENARGVSLPSISNSIAAAGVGVAARVVDAVTSTALATTRAAALALGLFLTPPVSSAIEAIANAVAPHVAASIGNLGFISPAQGRPAALTTSQSDALAAYNNAVDHFESILRQRRVQIDSKQP